MISFIYIAIGGIAFLAIVTLSDRSASNHGLPVYEKVDIRESRRFDADSLSSVIRDVQKRNNNIFILKDGALRREEILDALSRYFGGLDNYAALGDELNYLLFSFNLKHEILLSNGSIANVDCGRHALAARHLYDLWVSGKDVRTSRTNEKLLLANGVAILSCGGKLNGRVFLPLSLKERLLFESGICRFSTESAVLMLSIISGSLRVV